MAERQAGPVVMTLYPATGRGDRSSPSASHPADYSQDAPLAFFNAALETYERAESASDGRIERFFSIAGFPVRLRFAGSALPPYVVRALAHLSIDPVRDPALTICLWDSVSTHTPMPPPPWGPNDYLQAGEIREYINERFFTAFQIGVGVLSVLDFERGLGLYWIKSPQDIPYFESGAPMRVLLHPWLSRQRLIPVHAGAVGLPNGGVLLVGKGGSGKSNTALACLESRLLYASDDFCVLRTQPALTVFSLFGTGKVGAGDLQRLPFLASRISNREHLQEEKALFYLNEHFPEKLLRTFPIKAILIPRVTGKPQTALQPATPAAALASLAPSTVILAPRLAGATFQQLSGIVRQVPCYHLNVGTDPAQIPLVILDLLSQS